MRKVKFLRINIINFLLEEEMIAYKSRNEKSYVTI